MSQGHTHSSHPIDPHHVHVGGLGSWWLNPALSPVWSAERAVLWHRGLSSLQVSWRPAARAPAAPRPLGLSWPHAGAPASPSLHGRCREVPAPVHCRLNTSPWGELVASGAGGLRVSILSVAGPAEATESESASLSRPRCARQSLGDAYFIWSSFQKGPWPHPPGLGSVPSGGWRSVHRSITAAVSL